MEIGILRKSVLQPLTEKNSNPIIIDDSVDTMDSVQIEQQHCFVTPSAKRRLNFDDSQSGN